MRELISVCVTLAIVAPAFAQDATPPARTGDPLQIVYLGASGLSLRHGDDHIFTAPFFSNPSLWQLAFSRIKASPERFPAYMDDLASNASAILVGHAHYDHLMDVPLVARRMPATARIYGSRTTAHILAAAKLRQRIEVLNDKAGDASRAGEWISIPNTSIRFMPLLSGHAPHLGGIRLYDGEYRKDRRKLPRWPEDWRIGQPLSFVIDFLDPVARTIRFRVFYQDAATEAPEGFPPPMRDGRAFDLAVICVASFDEVDDHPEALLARLRPRAVLLVHWEDFFQSQSEPIEPVPGTDVDEFLERFEAAIPANTLWWMPIPQQRISLRPAATPKAVTIER